MINRCTDTDREENRCRYGQTDTHDHQDSHRYTDRQVDRQTEEQMHRETCKTVIDTQTDRQTARQESRFRQTGGRTEFMKEPC